MITVDPATGVDQNDIAGSIELLAIGTMWQRCGFPE